jgi:hypothetical protein
MHSMDSRDAEEDRAALSAVLVLIGLPAAGKSTLARLLVEHHARSLLGATGRLQSREPCLIAHTLHACTRMLDRSVSEPRALIRQLCHSCMPLQVQDWSNRFTTSALTSRKAPRKKTSARRHGR